MSEGELELRWPGKYDAAGQRAALSAPTTEIEVWERHGDDPARGELLLGDNLAALSRWRDRCGAEVDVVYMDPPFMTGGRFQARRTLSQDAGARAGEVVEVPGYEDRWSSPGEFLNMLDARVRWAHRLLAPHGSLYLHLDPTMGHAAKLMVDETFGVENFQREIIWRIGWVSGFKSRVRNWVRNHDSIFFYARDAGRLHFERQFVPYPEGYRRRRGKPSENPGIPMDDVWNASAAEAALSGRASLDSIQIKSLSREKTGWATQKNESLLERVVLASSRPDGWVADPFLGSGTTAVVAAQHGRRFLGADAAPLAVSLARARLLDVGASFTVAGDARLLARGEEAPGDGHAWPEVTLSHGADGRVCLHSVVSPDALAAVEDGGPGGPLWSVQSWCVLDERRRVVARAHRGRDGARPLEHELASVTNRPGFVRIYGIFGEMIEVMLERLGVTGGASAPVPCAALRQTTVTTPVAKDAPPAD